MFIKLNLTDGRPLYLRNDHIEVIMPSMDTDSTRIVTSSGQIFGVTETCQQIEEMIKQGSMGVWNPPSAPGYVVNKPPDITCSDKPLYDSPYAYGKKDK